MSPAQRLVAVVKANAYGHGAAVVARTLEAHVDAYQIDDLDELIELRRTTQSKVLVFGYVPLDGLEEAIRLDGELGIFDPEQVSLVGGTARRLGASVTVHIKIDALLGRLGSMPADVDRLIAALREWPELAVSSAYAHYANIEDTTDLIHPQAQLEAFDGAYQRLTQAFPGLQRHLSATSGLLTMEQSPVHQENDLVRVGIGLYGMYPSAALARTHTGLALAPVMRWVSHLAQVKELPAGHPVGYGLTYFASRPMRIAIVPQGYSDGYDRGLSNSGEVLVRGKRCPVIGRVAMNMFAIDVSEVAGAAREDEVVLLGAQGGERVTAEELAAKLGTINYEITSRISPLLPRTMTRE